AWRGLRRRGLKPQPGNLFPSAGVELSVYGAACPAGGRFPAAGEREVCAEVEIARLLEEEVGGIGSRRAGRGAVDQAGGDAGLGHQLGAEIRTAVAARLAEKPRPQRTAAAPQRQLAGETAQGETRGLLTHGEGGEAGALLGCEGSAATADPYRAFRLVFLQVRQEIGDADPERVVRSGFEDAEAAVGPGDHDAGVVRLAGEGQVVGNVPEATG